MGRRPGNGGRVLHIRWTVGRGKVGWSGGFPGDRSQDWDSELEVDPDVEASDGSDVPDEPQRLMLEDTLPTIDGVDSSETESIDGY